jgi:hypothetical protein
MKRIWIVRMLVLGVLLVQGLVAVPFAPATLLGRPITASEGATFYVMGEGLRIDVLAVGMMWYQDGKSVIFTELTAIHHRQKIDINLKLGTPVILHDLQIEMLAGDFRHHSTLKVTRIGGAL